MSNETPHRTEVWLPGAISIGKARLGDIRISIDSVDGMPFEQKIEVRDIIKLREELRLIFDAAVEVFVDQVRNPPRG